MKSFALFLCFSFFGSAFSNTNLEMTFLDLQKTLEKELVVYDDEYDTEQVATIEYVNGDYCHSILKVIERAKDPLGDIFTRIELEFNWGELVGEEYEIGFGNIITVQTDNRVFLKSANKQFVMKIFDLNAEWDFLGGSLVQVDQTKFGYYNLKFISYESAKHVEKLMGNMIYSCLKY